VEEEKKEEVQTEVSTTPVVEENKQPKSNGNKTLIIVIAIVALALICGCVLFLGNGSNGDKEKDTPVDTPKDNDSTDDPKEGTGELKELTDQEVISKLNKFIEVGIYTNDGYTTTGTLFALGADNISDSDKLLFTYQSAVSVNNKHKQLTEIPEKYKSEAGYLEPQFSFELNIDAFDKEYKSYFNSDPKYNDSDLINMGCPMIYKIDKELGIIILVNYCGGTDGVTYKYKNYKYEEDNKYYYVHQYVGSYNQSDKTFSKVKANEKVVVTTFEGNEEKFETVVWKFDKNFNFISTENKG
jgi:hypothetical protein